MAASERDLPALQTRGPQAPALTMLETTSCDLSDADCLRVAINVARGEANKLHVAPEELYTDAWEAIGVAKQKSRFASIPFKAWLIRVVRWELHQRARALRTFGTRNSSKVVVHSLPEALDEWLPAESASVDPAQRSDAALSLEAVVSGLTEHQRMVLALHYGEGHQLQEIGVAAKHTHRHAIFRLRQALGVDTMLPIHGQPKPKKPRKSQAGQPRTARGRARALKPLLGGHLEGR